MKEIDCEVTSREVFEKMKKNVFNNYNNYSDLSLNKDYLNSRLSIFKILYKITIQLGFKSQTYFLAAHYLDIIFSKKKKINNNICKLGLAALCLSSKYCENDPIVPHLKYFIKFYNSIVGHRNIISINILRYNEVVVCKLLNYKLNYYTIYDYNIFFFSHGLVKYEQLLQIEKDINMSSENKNNDFSINPRSVKSLLAKIYKKSRYFLEEIIKLHEICIKYNPLYVSVLIMKKSIEDILVKEYNIEKYDDEYKNNFYKRNDKYFKEIMKDYYNFEYESNEQYKELLINPELQKVFEQKEKEENKENCIRNYSRPHRLAVSKERNEVIKKKNIFTDSNTIFANSVSNGFYKKLIVKNNKDNNNNNTDSEKNTLTLRKVNNVEPSIDYLGKIKTFSISGRLRDNGDDNNDTHKSLYDFSKRTKRSEKSIIYNNSISSVKYQKSKMNRLNTFNNLHVYPMTALDHSMKINNIKYNNNYYIKSTNNNNRNKDNSKKKSPKYFEKLDSNEYKCEKIKKYIESIKINSLYDNNNKSINLETNKINNNNNNISDSFNQNIEKKTYIKKSIILNGKDPFNTSKKNLNKASTLSNFYYNKNIIKNTKHNIDNNNNNLTTFIINNNNNNNTPVQKLYEQNITKSNNENILIINEEKYINDEPTSANHINFAKSKTKSNNNFKKENKPKEFNLEKDNGIYFTKKKIVKNMKYATSEQFYPKHQNKIYVNTTKTTEFNNNDNIRTDRMKYYPSEINNILKEINQTYAKNIIKEKSIINNSNNNDNKDNNKDNNKKNEITVNILNKNNELNKHRKLNVKRNKSKNIKNESDKQIINNNINNENKAQSYVNYINQKNNNNKPNNMVSIRHKILIKNNINNKSEINKCENNYENPSSSIYQLLNPANFIAPTKKKEISEEKINYVNKKTTSSINFYKSQNNFYKNKHIMRSKEKNVNNNNNNNNSDENKKRILINKCKNSKSKDISCFKNQININKLNIENINCENQKNSTIIINNTININIENKAKKSFKPNNIPKLNINDILSNSNKNYNMDSKTSTNRKIKSNASNSNRTDNANVIVNRLFNKFPLNKKILNRSNH